MKSVFKLAVQTSIITVEDKAGSDSREVEAPCQRDEAHETDSVKEPQSLQYATKPTRLGSGSGLIHSESSTHPFCFI